MLNKKRIAIFVGFLCCLFFMTTFAGGTAQNTVIATRLVTFIDGYNNSTISEQTIEVGTDAEVPNDPRHEGLVFAGWYRYEDQDVRVTDFTNILEDTRVIAKYAGDLNGNGIADDDEARYTVTFRDSFDGSILGREEVLPGMSATAPAVPVHEGRTFVGWSGNYTNVTANMTVDTVYTVDVVAENPAQPIVEETFFTVTFVDGDTDEVIVETRVREGLTADTPNIPEHEKRVFDRFEGDYSNVTSDRTVRIIYTDDLNNNGIRDYLENHYTVEFTLLPYLKGGIRGSFAEGSTLKYENIVEGLTFEEIGIVIPNAIPENEHYSEAWKQVTDEAIVDWDNTENVTVNENLIYAAMFIPDVDTNADGIADSEQTYTLTINRVSRGSNGTYTLEAPEVKSVIAGTEIDLRKDFEGYKINATQNLTLTMPEADQEVTVYYHVNGKDENGNGKNDAEETYTLTVNYVSVGEKSNTTLDVVEANVVAGIVYPVERDFDGYTVKANQPTEITMPEEDTTVTIEYTVNGKDSNGNGKNDEEETYTLTVNYVSIGTKSNTILDTIETKVVAGTEYPIERDFDGYTVKENQPTEIIMPDSDTTVTVEYTVNGKDSNGNGKNDAEETYTLTVNYVSVGEKETHTLETITKEVLVGTEVTVEKDFDGYTVKENQPKTVTMPEEDTTVTVEYTVNGKDENGNGKNDTEETYTLTVNYVSVGEKETHTLETITKEVLVGTEVTVKKDFDGYTVKENQPKTVTMPEEDTTITVEYTANKDKNGNGQNDKEETFKLTIDYISVGEKEIYTLDTVTKEVLVGTEVTVEKDFDGYIVKENQPKNVTMPEEDTTVTVEYTVDGKDENGNGKNDTEETYTLTVNYVSVGEKETHTLETITKNVVAGIEYPIERDFDGYTVKENQPTEITMPDSDTTVTVEYTVNGKDENGNGKNDIEETYTLTIHRISKGSKSNTTLDVETVSVLAGTTIDLTKDIEGYILEDNQELSIIMPEKNIEAIVYYTVNGKDENGNGKNDVEETYILTVKYVNSKGVEIAPSTTQSVLAGKEEVVTSIPVTNYTAVETSKTIVMPEEDAIVTIEYTADIVGIYVTDNGNLLQFKVGSDKSKINEKISVYLVDSEGELREEVTNYTTNFDPNKSANTEYKLKVEYNYNGQYFQDESLIYILVTGEASENGFDLVNTGSQSYRKYNGNGLLPSWSGNWETVTPNYEFLELTQNYFGTVEMISAIANYDNVTSANLTVSSRVRYSWKGIFTGNYYSSVFIVSREDEEPIFEEDSTLETIVLTYRKDGIVYRMTFRYTDGKFEVESTERVS